MQHTRERMLGLTGRPFRGIHTRLLADVAAANLPPGTRILDVGTGPGNIPIEPATTARKSLGNWRSTAFPTVR
ncbi:hypothetical protein DLJ46_06355 [Micromonospora globispora]|uniref:Uncharacterized protein n=1 Tax=Micromonospora globispora TaxID=1450148 RepID=A0A317KBT4_9ACTN|nr:hypothetical protein [Micromonospora globispora]PWU50740.1 hypothetical protein DLJ46_06355 [Micromonospora globispora]RQX01359.1 hypothetical protein DKL51_05640 [Micromonospora globispora]